MTHLFSSFIGFQFLQSFFLGLLKPGSGPPPPPGFKGPPGPPPPGFPGGFATGSPELPEYLKKKAKREVDVPLKKIAWTSATVLIRNYKQLKKVQIYPLRNEDSFIIGVT